jgi:hypothetical protein
VRYLVRVTFDHDQEGAHFIHAESDESIHDQMETIKAKAITLEVDAAPVNEEREEAERKRTSQMWARDARP